MFKHVIKLKNMVTSKKLVLIAVLLVIFAACKVFEPELITTVVPSSTDLPLLTATPETTILPTVQPTKIPSASFFPVSAGKVIFSSKRDGNEEIYIMNADGTEQSNITQNPASDGLPAWSPDGSQIAFVSDRNGELDIFVMNTDGTGLQNLTNSPFVDTSPIWSPDGSQIAFISDRDGQTEIYLMNADGTQQTRLTTNLNTKGEPSWSPDGKNIAFTYNDFENYNWDIYIVNIETYAVARLTDDPEVDASPSWSPDSAYIYFMSERNRGRSLYRMYPDGSEEVQVIPPWIASMEKAQWSPDGKYFVQAWSPGDNRQSVYLFNPDGTEYRELTNGTYLDEDFSPSWSPDGQYITYSSNVDGNYEIYLVKIDETELIRLTNNDAMDTFPMWQPLSNTR